MLPETRLTAIKRSTGFIIADTHMDENPDQVKDSYLVLVLKPIFLRCSELNGKGKLDLLGDIIQLRGKESERPYLVLKKIIEAHPEVFELIKKIAEVAQVCWEIGNHDELLNDIQWKTAFYRLFPKVSVVVSQHLEMNIFGKEVVRFILHGNETDTIERKDPGRIGHAEVFDRNILVPVEEQLFPHLRKIQAIPILTFLHQSCKKSFREMKGFSALKVIAFAVSVMSQILLFIAKRRDKSLKKKIAKLSPGNLVTVGHYHRHDQDDNGNTILGGFGEVLQYDPRSNTLSLNFQGYIQVWGDNIDPKNSVYSVI